MMMGKVGEGARGGRESGGEWERGGGRRGRRANGDDTFDSRDDG